MRSPQTRSSTVRRPDKDHVEAADAFDKRHRKLAAACEKAVEKLAKEKGAPWISEHKERQFREAV